MGFCGAWCQGDDAGKAPGPELVTCDAVSAGERRKKLLGAEGSSKSLEEKAGGEKAVGADGSGGGSRLRSVRRG